MIAEREPAKMTNSYAPYKEWKRITALIICLLLALLPVLPASAARVLSASESSEVSDQTTSDGTITPHDQTVNMTPFQWGLSDESIVRDKHLKGAEPNSASVHALPDLTGTGSNMNGTVYAAILDGFVDYSHPDLHDVMVQFTAEEQQALGCGEWGYNATGIGDQSASSFTPEAHGTHCAGLMCASWDGHGISGAGSDIRLVSIQVADPHISEDYTGSILSGSLQRGLAFVDRYNSYYASRDPQKVIKIVSMSIGDPYSSLLMNNAIEELGRKYGTLTFIAAGNDGMNNDMNNENLGTMRQNPYAIIVGSTDQTEKLSWFSDFGVNTVDVAAPGSLMLSTVPMSQASYFPGMFTEGSYADIYNETFENYDPDNPTVEAFQVFWENGKYWGNRINTTVTGEQGSWVGKKALVCPLDPSRLSKNEERSEDGQTVYTASVCLRIQLTREQVMSIQDAGKYAQFGFIVRGSDHPVMMEYTLYNGTPIWERDEQVGNGVVALGRGRCEIFTDYMFISTASDTENGFYQAFPESLPDSGPFYLEAYFGLDLEQDVTEMVFDALSIGTNCVAYSVYNGTSMATPTAAGLGAVYASRHPEMSGLELASLIRASVKPIDSMKDKIMTGGRMDLKNDKTGTWTDPGAVEPAWSVYENELPLDKSTGIPFRPDSMGDAETYGLFLDGGDALWFLPVYLGDVINKDRSDCYIYRDVYCFDPSANAWDTSRASRIPGKPLWGCSACVWDGKLWVYGQEAEQRSDGFFYVKSLSESTSHMYSMDLATGVWTEHSVAGIRLPTAVFLFANDDGLRIIDIGVDGKKNKPEYPEKSVIYAYDPQKGVGDVLAEIKDENDCIINPVIVSRGRASYISEPDTNLMYKLEGTTVTRINFKLPAYSFDLNPDYYRTKALSNQHTAGYLDYVSFAVGDEAIYFVGRLDQDKKADTWVLPFGSSTVSPYSKHTANLRAISLSSVFHDGKIYAITADWGSDGARAFRSTRVEGTEPTPTPTVTPTATPKPVPKTGDPGHPLLWGLLVLSGIGTLLLIIGRRKARRNGSSSR